MPIALAIIAVIIAGCRLDPLVEDKPGASAHLLPRGAAVPSVTDNNDLATQIRTNDGIDDTVLAANMGAVPLGTGMSATKTVRYWSFGPATRAPSPMYVFYDATMKLLPGHPPMVDAVPGDRGYSPLHTLINVVTTDAYDGQLITTPAALADAIDLGLVEKPMPTGQFVDSPIVLPATKLDVGTVPAVSAEIVYARGFVAGMFRFGGTLGIQPAAGFLPTRQVSFLREPGQASYQTSRPIFQATVPTALDPKVATYSALSLVVNVDLASANADSITQDGDLYTRTGDTMTGKPGVVARFDVTTSYLLLQLQFDKDMP